MGVGGWPLGYEERRCWLIVCAISFEDFQPIKVTDRRTDDNNDMQSQNRALHYSASRGKYR